MKRYPLLDADVRRARQRHDGARMAREEAARLARFARLVAQTEAAYAIAYARRGRAGWEWMASLTESQDRCLAALERERRHVHF